MADVTAKLANIIDARQLAFNAGTNVGIGIGTTAQMYRTVEISDPDTNEPLGTIRIPKLGLRVNFVQEKFCIAEVTDLATEEGDSYSSSIFAGRKKVTNIRGAARSDTVYVEIGEEAKFSIPDKKSE